MAKELEKLSLADIIPGSIAGDENVQAIVQAIDPELQSASQSIAEALIYSRIDELPEPVLDALAWQWHVDFYELAHSVEGKREVVKGTLQWHRKKGTVWAILKALDMFGVKGTFTPWWEIEGARPYTFALDAELTDEYWKRSDWNDPAGVVRRAIVESKAARSFMESLYIHRDSKSHLDIVSGTATAQGIQQSVPIALHTKGTGHGDFVSGMASAQGVRQSIAIKKHDHGTAETLKPVFAMAPVRRGVHEIRLKPALTGAKGQFTWGGTVACGVRITVGAAGF